MSPPTSSGKTRIVTTLRTEQANACAANLAANSAYLMGVKTFAVAARSRPSSPQGFDLDRGGFCFSSSLCQARDHVEAKGPSNIMWKAPACTWSNRSSMTRTYCAVHTVPRRCGLRLHSAKDPVNFFACSTPPVCQHRSQAQLVGAEFGEDRRHTPRNSDGSHVVLLCTDMCCKERSACCNLYNSEDGRTSNRRQDLY